VLASPGSFDGVLQGKSSAKAWVRLINEGMNGESSKSHCFQLKTPSFKIPFDTQQCLPNHVNYARLVDGYYYYTIDKNWTSNLPDGLPYEYSTVRSRICYPTECLSGYSLVIPTGGNPRCE
jgi:hypothetical protein